MSTTARGVGAHDKHLSTKIARAVECADCHVVPAYVDAPGHLGLPPAEVRFSWIAGVDGQSPGWDGVTCAGTHCHNPIIGTVQSSGALVPAPAWTAPSQVGCGACHGLPPPAPHPQPTGAGFDCSGCHSDIDSTMQFTDVTRHVDGVIDF
jgi:predicted CxxxxCH...CXXCH cytochrome family protein